MTYNKIAGNTNPGANVQPYNSITGNVTVIDFPLVRTNLTDPVTSIDLIQFGDANDFMKNNTTVNSWPSALETIDTYFRELSSSVVTLTNRLNTIQDQLTSLTTKVDTYHPAETPKVTPIINVDTVSNTISNGGFIRVNVTITSNGDNVNGSLTLVTPSGTNWNAIIESSPSAITHVIKITNTKSDAGNDYISAGAIKVNFIPADTTRYNSVSNVTINNSAITLVGLQYYFYVGTTKPTSLSDATVVSEYPAEQTYTNNSGVKSKIFVLTNNDKTVTFIEPNLDVVLDQESIDTTTISEYKIFATLAKCANGGVTKIRIS